MARRGRKWVIKTAENGQPYFLLVGGNGEVIMNTETYSTDQKLWQTLNTLIGSKMPTRVEDLRGKDA